MNALRPLIVLVVVGMLYGGKSAPAQAQPINLTPDEPSVRGNVVYEAEDGVRSNWPKDQMSSGQQFGIFFNELEWLRAGSPLARILRMDEHSALREVLSRRDRGVFFAYLGAAPTGGYGIRITRIWTVEGDTIPKGSGEGALVIVEIERRKPEPQDFVIQAVTHPYDLVTVPLERLPEPPYVIAFIDEQGHGLQAYRIEQRNELVFGRSASVPEDLPPPFSNKSAGDESGPVN